MSPPLWPIRKKCCGKVNAKAVDGWDPMSVDWHGTMYTWTYSLVVHVDGRPEYVDDRWLNNCFATLLELMMTTSWPSSRQYTMGPEKIGAKCFRGYNNEARGPYFFRHTLYVSHGCSASISKTLPIMGRGVGPGGNGRPFRDREARR